MNVGRPACGCAALAQTYIEVELKISAGNELHRACAHARMVLAPPVMSALMRCMVTVGGSATKRASTAPAPCQGMIAQSCMGGNALSACHAQGSYRLPCKLLQNWYVAAAAVRRDSKVETQRVNNDDHSLVKVLSAPAACAQVGWAVAALRWRQGGIGAIAEVSAGAEPLQLHTGQEEATCKQRGGCRVQPKEDQELKEELALL